VSISFSKKGRGNPPEDLGQRISRINTLENVLFVIGFFRSGTSLLYALLNQHPAIGLTYEGDLFKFWPAIRAGGLLGNWQKRIEFWNNALSRHDVTYAQVADARNRREAALALYRNYGARKGATIIGAKTPVYHNCVRIVASEFPAAKFVIIWRSPWEILRSVRAAGQTARYFSSSTWAQYVAVGVKQMLLDCAFLRSSGRKVFELNYQLLIEDRARTFQKMCEFLGIPFDSRMTELAGADVTAVPSGEHHGALRTGQVLTRKKQSADGLSPRDQRVLESAFDNFENPPWNSRSVEDVVEDAAQCALRARLSFGENLWRIRFDSFDVFVRFVYAFWPFFMLKGWRKWRDRRFAARMEAQAGR
jgi:hypothetical protein